ncbi:hypothetical protein [Dyella silvatica]|uniref:hypothetical protein n=1 Tax=Dyella silvatica TaxID=2992128 RepID=UPI002252171B|nr:hypothetical protein [Dyella silvatica]
MSTSFAKYLGGGLLLVSLGLSGLHAAESPQTASPSPSCVEVSVNDRPTLAYDCLGQALLSPKAATPPSLLMDGVVNEPSNRQVGQYNFSAFSHRMGANLDKSVVPQRPPAAPPPPLFAPVTGGH